MLSGLEHKIQSKLESIDSAYKQVQINFAQTYKFKLQEEQDNPIPEDESKMQESLPDIKNMLESDSNTDLPQ